MKPARTPLRGAALKAAVAAKEAAARDAERFSEAQRVQDAAIAVALAPAGGWWRAPNGGRWGKPVLRRQAVLDAYSVGATPAQIARAAGATVSAIFRVLKVATTRGDALDVRRRPRRSEAAR